MRGSSGRELNLTFAQDEASGRQDGGSRRGRAAGWVGKQQQWCIMERQTEARAREKKDQSGCLFFLPAEKAFIDGSGYIWKHWAFFFLTYPFFTPLPPPNPPLFLFSRSSFSPGSWRAACKVSSRVQSYKNNPGFIGIATGGWHGGVRVKWVIRHNSPLLPERTAPVYSVLTAAHTRTE